jgi:hypothetical protein
MKQNLGNTYTVEIAGQSLQGTVGSIGKHQVVDLGEIAVPAGHHTLTVKSKQQKPGSDLVNLTDISFVPVK